MIGSDRKLDPFAGKREHSLLECGIAVARVGERVDVRVATYVAGKRDHAADAKSFPGGITGFEFQRCRIEAVGESSAGVEAIGS